MFIENSSHQSLENDAPKKEESAIMLWHTAKNASSLSSFLHQGVMPVGVGQGGQKDGFYLWNTKGYAKKHFCDFLYKDKSGTGLLVGITVDDKSLHYPDWQFDIEITKELNPLLFKYQERISQINNLNYLDDSGQEHAVFLMKVVPGAQSEHCPIHFREKGHSYTLSIGDPSNGISGCAMYQALIDRLCQYDDFKNDYNKLLQQSVQSDKRFAIKYCGNNHLPVDKICYLKKDPQKINLEKEIDLSKHKEKSPNSLYLFCSKLFHQK